MECIWNNVKKRKVWINAWNRYRQTNRNKHGITMGHKTCRATSYSVQYIRTAAPVNSHRFGNSGPMSSLSTS